MAPGHLPGHSRQEGEVIPMENNAMTRSCQKTSHLPICLSSGHIHFFIQWLFGGISFVSVSVLGPGDTL